jgi:hypothetical protein
MKRVRTVERVIVLILQWTSRPDRMRASVTK